MQINWKVRLQSCGFWISMISAVVAFVYQICGILGIVPAISEEMAMQFIGVVINILMALGIIIDPTTAGFSDSQRALKYKTPHNDLI